MHMSCHLCELPDELLLACLDYLEGGRHDQDLKTLSQTCRWLNRWISEHESTLYRHWFQRRFPRLCLTSDTSSEPQRTAKESYRSALHINPRLQQALPSIHGDGTLICPAESMSIAWLNDRYWEFISSSSQTQPASGSWFPRFARLHAVCWLDATATCHGVPKGRYRVCWKLRLATAHSIRQLANIRCIVRVLPHPALSKDSPEQDLPVVVSECRFGELSRHSLPGPGSWWVYTMPEMVSLDDYGAYSTVLLSLTEISDGTWKSGMDVDAVFLKPVFPASPSNAPDVQSQEAESIEEEEEVTPTPEQFPPLPNIFGIPLNRPTGDQNQCTIS